MRPGVVDRKGAKVREVERKRGVSQIGNSLVVGRGGVKVQAEFREEFYNGCSDKVIVVLAVLES